MKNNGGLSAWRGFLESLEDDIYSSGNRIPLQNLCRDGIATLKDDFEITNLVLREIKAAKISGRFTIPFCEVSKTGCASVSWKVERTAEIDFIFDTSSGEMAFVEDQLSSYE